MTRAVLDTGVLIAALLSPTGAPAQLVLAWLDGRFDLIVSPKLLGELQRVLLRPKFRRYVTEEEAAAYVEGLARLAEVAPDPDVVERVTPDPGDDFLVALGRAAEADVLVSGDPHLTGLRRADPPVLTPRGFLERLG